jgi:hypothetical protein
MSASKAAQLASARRETLTASDPDPVMKCRKQKAWVEIALEDHNGVRIPGEEYLVSAPDGTEYGGVLDQNGSVRIEGLDPGDCQVSFPRLDRSEWKRS